nr:hypothetical protein [Tanacetum cinerariifolium]
KSDASKGFAQIIDFLSGSYIHYALTVSPPIYISCIKQFWNTAVVKHSGDVTSFGIQLWSSARVTSLGVVCLPNEEIFAGLAQMGYEKPTSWNEFSTAMASVVICLSKGQRFNFSRPPPLQAAEGSSLLVQQVLDKCSALVLRVKGLETANTAQQLEILKLKARVVVASTPIPTAKPAVVAVSTPISAAKPKYIKRYHGFKRKSQSESEARKNMIAYLKNTDGFKMAFFKGKTYDQILPIFQARFDANMRFLFKSREKMEKEEEEIIKSINETPVQKASKRRRLRKQAKEDEDLKKQLEVVVDEDDDVFTEATPIGRKSMEVLDYTILQSLSAKRTSWNEFSTTMASAVIYVENSETGSSKIINTLSNL